MSSAATLDRAKAFQERMNRMKQERAKNSITTTTTAPAPSQLAQSQPQAQRPLPPGLSIPPLNSTIARPPASSNGISSAGNSSEQSRPPRSFKEHFTGNPDPDLDGGTGSRTSGTAPTVKPTSSNSTTVPPPYSAMAGGLAKWGTPTSTTINAPTTPTTATFASSPIPNPIAAGNPMTDAVSWMQNLQRDQQQKTAEIVRLVSSLKESESERLRLAARSNQMEEKWHVARKKQEELEAELGDENAMHERKLEEMSRRMRSTSEEAEKKESLLREEYEKKGKEALTVVRMKDLNEAFKFLGLERGASDIEILTTYHNKITAVSSPVLRGAFLAIAVSRPASIALKPTLDALLSEELIAYSKQTSIPLDTILTAFVDAQKKLQKVEQQVISFKKEAEKRLNEVKVTNERVKELEEKLKGFNGPSTKVQVLLTDLENLKKKYEGVEKENERLNKELDHEKNEARMNMEGAEEHNSSLERKIEELQKENDDLTRQNADSKRAPSPARTLVAASETGNNPNAAFALKKLVATIGDLNQQLAKKTEENSELMVKLANMELDVSD